MKSTSECKIWNSIVYEDGGDEMNKHGSTLINDR